MNKNNRARQKLQGNKTVSTSKGEQHPGTMVAIPCFNEERFIGSVVLKARNYADHVIVIDDGSTDKTAMVAELAGAQVIKHNCNEGKGVAVNTAFEYAQEIECKALVLLDGDGQHEPADIPIVLEPILNDQADMVVGSRFLGMKGSIPRYRVWGQHVLTFFTNIGSQIKLTDSQSGFRAFSPSAIKAFSFAEKGLSVESEMQFLAKEADLRVTEVPIGMTYYDKAKRSPLAHGMGVLNAIMGLISKRIPLFFFGVPGLIMLGFGFWEGYRVVHGYNIYHEFFLGPALLAVLLCVVGALSLFTGLILHTVKSYLK